MAARPDCAARSGAVALSELRAVGHHVARAARRPRRPQAGAAPHPLHDVAAEPDRRRQAPQVREGRRRRDGQLPPARRRGALRNARPHGAVVLAALSAGRRLRQFRLARRRQRRGDALHRVPPGAHQRRDAHRDRADDGATSGRTTTAPRPSRSSCRRASRTCWSTAPPASPSAWRPTSRRTTSARCARRWSSCSTTRTSSSAQLCRYVKGPDFPTGGQILNSPDELQGDLQDRLGLDPAARHLGHRPGDALDQDDLHRQRALHGQQGAARRADRRRRHRAASCRSCSTSRTCRPRTCASRSR